MSKAINICLRTNKKNNLESFSSALNKIMNFGKFSPNKPYVKIDGKTLTYIYNPQLDLIADNFSYCLGVTDTNANKVLKFGYRVPDGNFALTRCTKEKVELISDYTGMRTIWYYKNDDLFISSTSQRMIISFIGKFKINNSTIKWMLSSGTLGPDNSWDERLKPLKANSKITFDRVNWKINIKSSKAIEILPILKSKTGHKKDFNLSLKSTISNLKINNSRWKLALSGGKDSRCIYYFLKNKKGLKTITWGLRNSKKESLSDASIALKLAQKHDCAHVYKETDFKNENFLVILNRFLEAGEGRIDHISGYMDGLKLWMEMSESNFSIIRGYDALGATDRKISNSRQARMVADLKLTTDYKKSIIPKHLRISENDIPIELLKKENESLSQWRDKLWLNFRTPVVTSALDDIKVTFVEIVNPLLYKKIVKTICQLPDNLRNNKSLFTEIVNDMYKEIPYASVASINDADEILSNKNIINILKDELSFHKNNGLIDDRFIDDLILRIKEKNKSLSFRRFIRHFYRLYAPSFIKKYVEKKINHYPEDIRRLALRVLIILKMNVIFNKDIGIYEKEKHS